MKIFIMTDLEGVAGVLDRQNWTLGGTSEHYPEGKSLLTGEVNAAIKALFEGGADEVHVADGHGCGAINPEELDSRAILHNKWVAPVYPFKLDNTFDAAIFIGQHAKAGTVNAHLPHTGSHKVLDRFINGRSFGEFGVITILADYFGLPVIFGSGDTAFCKEAVTIVPNIVTTAVKTGDNPDNGEQYCFEIYKDYNTKCTSHLPKEEARLNIYEGAAKAIDLLKKNGKDYFKTTGLPIAPYYMLAEYRKSGGNWAHAAFASHPDNPVELLNKKEEKIYEISHRGNKTSID